MLLLDERRILRTPKAEKKVVGRSPVIISGFESYPNVMRKEDPTWKFALGASPVTEGSILRIVDEQIGRAHV